MINIVHNSDCLPAMREMDDNQYDLAIVDPPYGLGGGLQDISPSFRKRDGRREYHKTKYSKLSGAGKLKNRILNSDNCEWDKKQPTKEYFDELFRISINQIICGGNYFDLPPSRGFVVWDKMQPFPNFSRCEYLWISFQVPSKLFVHDNRTKGKIHPTQKPIEIYKYLLKNYAKEGDTILDTHVGSGSSRIACWEMGFDFTGYEIDKDYWEAQEKRFKIVKNQMRLF